MYKIKKTVMDITFLKAGNGDSILISHNSHNILIDGGNDSCFLLKEIDAIKEKREIIDLLIITHQDDDHIKGIEDLLKHIDTYHDRDQFIKKILFNSPRLIKGTLHTNNDDSHLSYRQAYNVENLIKRLRFEVECCTDKTAHIQFDKLNIKVLSPIQEDLDKYSDAKGAYLSNNDRCDWSKSLSHLDKYIDDDNLDDDPMNRTSIVLDISIEDRKVLLTGDITPDRFEKIINGMYISNGNKPVHFDLIKLPHHGSYRNLTKNVLEKIDCSTFVISTNGKKYSLPNKRALLKIFKYMPNTFNKEIEFIFNYESVLDLLKITPQEMKQYNFKLTSSQNNVSWR